MISGLPLPFDAVFWRDVPDPAMGAQWAYTFPDGYEYLLTAVSFVFTASGVVITRYPGLVLTFDGLPFFIRSTLGATAGSSKYYNFISGQSYIETAAPPCQHLTLPYPLIVKGGITNTVQSDVVNMQGTDTLTTIVLCFLRMPLTQ